MSTFLNLGLEVLSASGGNAKKDISFELLDAECRTNSAYAAVQNGMFDGEKLMIAFENILSVKSAISKYGRSPSLEALVGNSFGGSISLEAVSTAEKAWYTRVIEWFKKMWGTITLWFKELFDRNLHWTNAINAALKDWKVKFDPTKDYNCIIGSDLKDYLDFNIIGDEIDELAKWNPDDGIKPKLQTIDAGKVKAALQYIKTTFADLGKFKQKVDQFFQRSIQEIQQKTAKNVKGADKIRADVAKRREDFGKAQTNLNIINQRMRAQASFYCKLAAEGKKAYAKGD